MHTSPVALAGGTPGPVAVRGGQSTGAVSFVDVLTQVSPSAPNRGASESSDTGISSDAPDPSPAGNTHPITPTGDDTVPRSGDATESAVGGGPGTGDLVAEDPGLRSDAGEGNPLPGVTAAGVDSLAVTGVDGSSVPLTGGDGDLAGESINDTPAAAATAATPAGSEFAGQGPPSAASGTAGPSPLAVPTVAQVPLPGGEQAPGTVSPETAHQPVVSDSALPADTAGTPAPEPAVEGGDAASATLPTRPATSTTGTAPVANSGQPGALVSEGATEGPASAAAGTDAPSDSGSESGSDGTADPHPFPAGSRGESRGVSGITDDGALAPTTATPGVATARALTGSSSMTTATVRANTHVLADAITRAAPAAPTTIRVSLTPVGMDPVNVVISLVRGTVKVQLHSTQATLAAFDRGDLASTLAKTGIELSPGRLAPESPADRRPSDSTGRDSGTRDGSQHDRRDTNEQHPHRESRERFTWTLDRSSALPAATSGD